MIGRHTTLALEARRDKRASRAVVSDGRLRVMLVIDDLEFGGAQRQVLELANNIDPLLFDAHVCSLSRYVPLAEGLTRRDARLHVLDCGHGRRLLAVFRLARLLRARRIDVVHGYLRAADVISRLAGTLAGTPVVVSSQRTGATELTARTALAERLTGFLADRVVANSRSGAEAHRRAMKRPASRYRVVYNGVNTELFSPRPADDVRAEMGIGPWQRLVGVFASFKPKKNHPLFFRAAATVAGRLPDVRFLVVGDVPHEGPGRDGYRRGLDDLVDRLQLRERCVFPGNRRDLPALYNACDLTVLPSSVEGMPNVLLESMACGVPVVATDVADNASVVPDGRAGFLTPPGDSDAMARRMCEMLTGDEMRLQMGAEARRWASREFSVDLLARRTAAVYVECLEDRRRRRG
jgi:glycosyltransferase involved in cell wall biosynthesis